MATHVSDQSPTAAQHTEFWKQVGLGLITKANFQEFLEKKKTVNPYLRLISGGGTIPEVHEMYWKDSDFKTLFGSLCPDLVKRYGYTTLPDVDINEVKISLKKNNMMFESLEQIETFCEENKQGLLKDNHRIFFLSTEEVDGEEEFFVVNVGVGMIFYSLSVDVEWDVSLAYRFVIPTTKTSDTQN